MKKNYLVFGGSNYYPNAGFGDFEGGYSSFEEADIAARSIPQFDWLKITCYDQDTGTHKSWWWNDRDKKWEDDENYDVVVNPNGEFLGKLVVTYKETGERIPVSPPLEEFRKAIQEEIDAEIMETIRKAVQDANKEKP